LDSLRLLLVLKQVDPEKDEGLPSLPETHRKQL